MDFGAHYLEKTAESAIFGKFLLNHHAGWGANTSASTYLWVNEREKRMGNHMDKVMDGLYVGGFLGQYKGQRTKFHTTKNSLKSLNHFDLQEPRRERNWRRTRSLTYYLFTIWLNLSSQMYALFTVVLTDHNFVIIITIIVPVYISGFHVQMHQDSRQLQLRLVSVCVCYL